MVRTAEHVQVTVTVEGFGSKSGVLDQMDHEGHATRPYHILFEDGQQGWFEEEQIVIGKVVPPVDPFVAAVDAVLKAKPKENKHFTTAYPLPRLNEADDSSDDETRDADR